MSDQTCVGEGCSLSLCTGASTCSEENAACGWFCVSRSSMKVEHNQKQCSFTVSSLAGPYFQRCITRLWCHLPSYNSKTRTARKSNWRLANVNGCLSTRAQQVTSHRSRLYPGSRSKPAVTGPHEEKPYRKRMDGKTGSDARGSHILVRRSRKSSTRGGRSKNFRASLLYLLVLPQSSWNTICALSD